MRGEHGYDEAMLDVVATPAALDLDLRLVRYFTVVAEHGNFGRAAAALHLAQPSLSRQIQRLESQLGVRLLDRTPHGSRLTEAGEAFLPQARELLRAAHHATATARAAAPAGAITVGYVEDIVITAAVRDLRLRHPDAEVNARHLDWTDAQAALLERRVDAVVARLPFPFPSDRIDMAVLYEEPLVLVVPLSHRLAGRASVTPADFSAEARVPCPLTGVAVPDWTRFWRLDPERGEAPVPLAPVGAGSFEDKLELVAGGQAVAMRPAGDRRFTLRGDLTTVPIEGADPCQVVLATRSGDDDRLVAAFAACARAHLTGWSPQAQAAGAAG